MTLDEFGRKNGLVLSMSTFDGEWQARFADTELSAGGLLRSVFGTGPSAEHARQDYYDKIRGGLLIFRASSRGLRREIEVPDDLEEPETATETGEPVPAAVSLDDFADEHGLSLRVTRSQSDGRIRLVKFADCYVIDGGRTSYESGKGRTTRDARRAYCANIAGKTLVVHAHDLLSCRQIRVPDNLIESQAPAQNAAEEPAPAYVSLRDFLAAHAPLSVLVTGDGLGLMARKAYEWADAMLKVREPRDA
jgi:hypothetical protein